MQFKIGSFRIGGKTDKPSLKYLHEDGTVEPIMMSTNILLLLDVAKVLATDKTFNKKKKQIHHAIQKAVDKMIKRDQKRWSKASEHKENRDDQEQDQEVARIQAQEGDRQQEEGSGYAQEAQACA